MPSHQEFYERLSNISVNADTLNLNTDQVETKLDTANGILTTLSADTALVKADIANGVTINQPVAVTDNNGSLTVDGSVSVSNFPATQPVSGTVTANAGTGSFTVAQATHANLKAQAQILDSSGNQVTYASTGAAGTPASDVVTVQGISGGTPLPIRPRNGTITVTTGTTSGTANTSSQALASNTSRQYLLIQNISDTDMYFNFGAAATTSNLLVAKSGSGIVFESGFVPTDAVNVICSAASKAYYILSA